MIGRLVVLAMLLMPVAAMAGTVTVFAAASLRGALDDVARAFESRHKDERIIISYAGSSALARQIEAGAPADLFISADEDWMDHVAAKGLIHAASRHNLLANSLVLIAPAERAARLPIAPGFPLRARLGASQREGRLAMAVTASVPAGKYGKAALTALGVWDDVRDRVAEAENVRAALAYVARGEAPLGIVYGTDARAEPRVRVVGVFPADSHPAILYPVARLKSSAAPEAGVFLAFLKTAEARTIFERHGFTAP